MFTRTTLGMALAVAAFGAEAGNPRAENPLTVHEWGTFTSVADVDGSAVVWGALGGPADLPCFVHRSPQFVKGAMFTRVRMETPVLYFYAHRPVTASAKVSFRNGHMTEWYPDAISGGQTLEWKNIEVLPGADAELPVSKGESHYFAARETDAAALRVGQEREKLLFYRGTGDFQPPPRPRFDGSGAVEIRGNIGRAILFENRGGKVGWRAVVDREKVERPNLTGDIATVRAELVGMLTEAGLYQKEAQAMVETWRDSWFEEGLRLLYVAPLEFVDRILPLQVNPHPREIARVFMGRVEMLSPERRDALARSMETGDFAEAASYGRFFSAFARQVAKPSTPSESMNFLAAQESKATVGGCVQ